MCSCSASTLVLLQVGELLNERYEVFATHGKGVFSTVLRARDLHPVTPKGEPIPVIGTNFPEVAIKVIRSNDLMTKAGKAEEVILQKLAGADPSNKYHVIRLLGSFKYRGHLCLCFEPLVCFFTCLLQHLRIKPAHVVPTAGSSGSIFSFASHWSLLRWSHSSAFPWITDIRFQSFELPDCPGGSLVGQPRS